MAGAPAAGCIVISWFGSFGSWLRFGYFNLQGFTNLELMLPVYKGREP
jgi:hypothetical protein